MIIIIKYAKYKDIKDNNYLIDDDGNIYKLNGKKLKGCNPKSNNGYIRVSLLNKNGKIKKYLLHRIVISTFLGESDLYVDHINGDKTCNKLSNLEYVTAKENSIRAHKLQLCEVCENHYKSVLTNELVNKICKLFEDGYNIRKIQKILNLKDVKNIDKIMTDILYKKSWTQISNKYTWNINNIKYKKYSYDDLYCIAKLILSNKHTSKEIANEFPSYNQKKLINVIKKMRQGKLYKEIIKEVKCSTTINDNGYIHIHRSY